MRACDVCASKNAQEILIARTLPRGTAIDVDYWPTDLCASCAMKLTILLNEQRRAVGALLLKPEWWIRGEKGG